MPIHRLYAIFALLALFLIAPKMPPFQNADELAHVLRADQISHLAFFVRGLPDGEQGGWVDAGIPGAQAPFQALPGHLEQKVMPAMSATSERVAWGGLVPAGFPNTAIYPPVFYFPAALALAVSRGLHLSVLHGVMVARLAMGLATIAMGVTALALAEAEAIWLYAMLLLPMTMALMAGAVQDGPMLGATALAAVLCARLRQDKAPRWMLPLACLLLACIGMARPPYAGFVLILLAARHSWPARLIAMAAALLAVVLWSAANAPHMLLVAGPAQINAAAQLHGLLAAPWLLVPLLIRTTRQFGVDVLHGFIGQPGWLDVILPRHYHILAWIMLLGTAILSFARTRPGLISWAGLAGIAAAILGVALIEYLTWTPVGAAVIGGLQGRYFIPPAMMLAAVLPAKTLPRMVVWPILLFPLISIPVLLQAIMHRYYL